MPWSYGDDIKREALHALSHPRRVARIAGVLDIGAGAGQWRTQSLGLPIGRPRWVALEGFAPYVNRFGLRERYDQVIVKDLRRIKYGRYPGWAFLFGDVLEHLDRADALAVMRRACSMGTVVAVMPFHPTASEHQDAVDGNELERHRYVWHWDEWVDAVRSLGYEPEPLAVPPGDERNKGATICWHPRHRIDVAA